MFCLAVYITIQSGVDPRVCDESCIADRNFRRVQKQKQILNHKTKQRPNHGPDIVHILLGLVLNCRVSFPAQHILNECYDLVQ
jgi:hypothetical protein